MARNVFDEDENYWDEPKAKSMWDDSEEDSFQDETKSLKLNFRLNPKIAAISAVSVLSLIAVISIVPGLFSGDGEPKPVPTAVESSAPVVPIDVDLYSKPKMLESFIDNSLASSVSVNCGNGSGSGWAIDLSDDPSTNRDDLYTTEIVTNQHVIEGCESSGVTISLMGEEATYEAYVYSYDQGNDLAILITDKFIPPFATRQPGYETKVGQWVMAVGSPGAEYVFGSTLKGSITTGTVTNFKNGFIITDTTINPGNSGGPLLNSSGQVVGVVTAKIQSERVDRIGVVQDVDRICDQLDGCTKKQILK
jgi:S1-C subfamily serine protease